LICYLQHDINDDGLELKGLSVEWIKEPQVFFAVALYILCTLKRREITHVIHTIKKRWEEKKKKKNSIIVSESPLIETSMNDCHQLFFSFFATLSGFFFNNLVLSVDRLLVSKLRWNKIIIRIIITLVKIVTTEGKSYSVYPLFLSDMSHYHSSILSFTISNILTSTTTTKTPSARDIPNRFFL